MKLSLADRLLHRELRDPYHHTLAKDAAARSTNVRGFYGDKRWVEDLDIVNELGGHTGCVNALSWSRSGKLLASGSDDTHLNIHTYQPERSTQPFALSTTIATGHSANIFSVKFMPHSNDSTLVSCAGDHEVRIFDIERSGRTHDTSNIPLSSVRHHSRVNLAELYRGVQFLGPSSTNARVYRSHGDRVKRIVTESSPHLFLTCSEDGEVRQWDLRLPSSAYPSPREFGSRSSAQHQVPPPLISYKRFRLDLNTISCSASQPHYIVLGGAHLHAFLHDRRMLGRDVGAERGTPVRAASSATNAEDEFMSKATHCVRRFAPNGQKRMNRNDNGHITACKISDANPNEMIGSWSGDHIYAFNLIAAPDAGENTLAEDSRMKTNEEVRRVGGNDKKRKRRQTVRGQSSRLSVEGAERGSARHRASTTENSGDIALRVRYGNGQSEDISLGESPDAMDETVVTPMSDAQQICKGLAKSMSKIRQLLFSPEVASSSSSSPSPIHDHAESFSDALGRASAILPMMEKIATSWSYPLLPDAETVVTQTTMRRNRAASCRFVQAAGTLAHVLGGRVNSLDPEAREAIESRFRILEHDPGQASDFTFGSTYQRFCYLFLASILAWLNGGTAGLLSWFKPSERRRFQFSIQSCDGEEAIHDKIIPGLLALANEQERAIINVDAGRFEVDANRVLFSKGAEAVIAFSHAIRIPLQSSVSALAANPASGSLPQDHAGSSAQLRDTTVKFWAYKVGRGLLLSAGEGVNYAFVNTAFGGLRQRAHVSEGRNQQDVDPEESEEPIERISVLGSAVPTQVPDSMMSNSHSPSESEHGEMSDTDQLSSAAGEEEMVSARDIHTVLHENGLATGDSSNDGDDTDSEDILLVDDDEIDDDSSESNISGDADDDSDNAPDVEDDADSETDFDPRIIFGNASSLGRDREKVEADVPCSSHTRVYRGHCNVKTVKDVNFFGQEDEYVVSGSDSGHLFIWDRHTGGLLNVLQGDAEVVNVITGHPYEPMLAASGIDHTIKIFSPDQRAQHDARKGINLGTSSHRSHGVSSIMRRRPRSSVDAIPFTDDTGMDVANLGANDAPTAIFEEDSVERERATNGGLESCRRMQDSYQITSQNDLDRQGGLEEPFMTRSMLAHFAARLRARRLQNAAQGGTAGNGEDEDDETILMDENCTLM